MNLRKNKKRDYRQMLDGDENYMKTIEDEQKEIYENCKDVREQLDS